MNRKTKKKILFILSLIIFLTSILFKAHKTINSLLHHENSINLKENEKQNNEESIKKINELIDTMDAGIDYLEKKLKSSDLKEVKVTLSNDLIDAVDSIQKTLENSKKNIDVKILNEKSQLLKESLYELRKGLKKIENKDHIFHLYNKVIKNYNSWKKFVTSVTVICKVDCRK